MQYGGLHDPEAFRITANDLRQLRDSRGWSQLELAERLGVSRSTVQAWERGSRGAPPILTLALIGLNAVEASD